eukprot:TRINITY_DN72987_c0_g1_i1.p1 TRINITY_DN72987_c0_g1~~TRINITY_DN72987_c0_g1_i1.p1  ORF type:complete len:263 (+),score=27.03 TRINITY_DN72987_c0_g1_i1:200-988(+)
MGNRSSGRASCGREKPLELASSEVDEVARGMYLAGGPTRVTRTTIAASRKTVQDRRKTVAQLETGGTTRMSRAGSVFRARMISRIQKAVVPSGEVPPILEKRLESFGGRSMEMEGDGNCQFRSFAFNLFGDQAHHGSVRKAAIAHIKKNSDFFRIFFEDEREFKNFLRDMAKNRTWGDELTLRAVVEAYGCVAHVVTSEPANWFLVYEPEEDTAAFDPKIAVCPRGYQTPPKGKQVFLSYVSPIHYNAIVASPRHPSAPATE